MPQYIQEGFAAERAQLNYFYDVVMKTTLESVAVQELSSISTEPQSRNVQVPLTTIDAISEDVNSSLQQLQGVVVDINKLPAQTIVQI